MIKKRCDSKDFFHVVFLTGQTLKESTTTIHFAILLHEVETDSDNIRNRKVKIPTNISIFQLYDILYKPLQQISHLFYFILTATTWKLLPN